MTTKSKSQDNPYANRDHEHLRENDQLAVAQLFNRVGGELTTVDHHMVGDGLGRAQRLDPNVVQKLQPSNGSTPPQAPPQAPPMAVTNAPVQQEISQPPPAVAPIPPPDPLIDEMSTVPLTDALDEVATSLSQRINDLEDKVHFHFDKLEKTLEAMKSIYETIVERLPKDDIEITIKSAEKQPSENTD